MKKSNAFLNSKKMWEPSRESAEASRLHAFARALEQTHGIELPDFGSLHAWSVAHPADFWRAVWDECGVKASRGFDSVLDGESRMPGARWFSGARLNFAENLLRFSDDRTALVFLGERRVRRTVSYAELSRTVARLAAALRARGVAPGDRVAGYVANMPEAIAAMLAAASIGAVWCSTSPDFGVQGVLDRFQQLEPKVLFAVDGYFYKGAPVSCLENIRQIAAALPSAKDIVLVPYLDEPRAIRNIPRAVHLSDLLAEGGDASPRYEQLPPEHPIYVMFSSGTTGKPKCIVHSAGGVLLEHLKELLLHTDLRAQDVFFYQTTCGWMMWNWLVSGLAAGATLVLYDGFPLLAAGNVLFDIADEERVSIFGSNAKYLSLIEKEGLEPRRTHRLERLHTITSTGSPLLPESYDYVYERVKPDVRLSSIAGGTDILGCFTLGAPTLPVYRGETQCLSLGLDVRVYTPDGKPLSRGRGELVCAAPFPSMPLGFWGDTDGSRYRAAYFERFPGMWHHGDYVELTQHGGLVMHGRSDAVLNPGGVRIGTAEIYRQVEKCEEVIESIAVGQTWEGDERIVLFVRLREGTLLDEALKKKLRDTIRRNASPFHVPKKIVQVADIPRTKSGKITELAVRDVVAGREVANREALANPEALELFRDLPELTEP